VTVLKGLKNNEARNIAKNSSSLAVLMVLLTDTFWPLVKQTNLYYQQYGDKQAGHSPFPDTMWPDIMSFLCYSCTAGT
jgi:hypothetical protein